MGDLPLELVRMLISRAVFETIEPTSLKFFPLLKKIVIECHMMSSINVVVLGHFLWGGNPIKSP
jgi:hypothetical protein